MWDCFTVLWNNVIFCKIPLILICHAFRTFVVSFFLMTCTIASVQDDAEIHSIKGPYSISWTFVWFFTGLSLKRYMFNCVSTVVVFHMWGIFSEWPQLGLILRSNSWFVMESGASSAHLWLNPLNSRTYPSYLFPLRTNAAFITCGHVRNSCHKSQKLRFCGVSPLNLSLLVAEINMKITICTRIFYRKMNCITYDALRVCLNYPTTCNECSKRQLQHVHSADQQSFTHSLLWDTSTLPAHTF